MAERFADIYLPDHKYADSALSPRLSKCVDYPNKALEAIVEMVRQKGFLEDSDSPSHMAGKESRRENLARYVAGILFSGENDRFILDTQWEMTYTLAPIKGVRITSLTSPHYHYLTL